MARADAHRREGRGEAALSPAGCGAERSGERTGECGEKGGATSDERAVSMPCAGKEGDATRLAPTGGQRSSSAELVDRKSRCVHDAARGNMLVVSVAWRAALPCAWCAPHRRDPSTAKRRRAARDVRRGCQGARSECGVVAYIVLAIDVTIFRSMELTPVVHVAHRIVGFRDLVSLIQSLVVNCLWRSALQACKL